MLEKLREHMLTFITIFVFVLSVLIGGISLYPSLVRRNALLAQDAELQRVIDEKKREIDQLLENQRRFRTDPDFVEAIARRNRRVFPGELVFIFED